MEFKFHSRGHGKAAEWVKQMEELRETIKNIKVQPNITDYGDLKYQKNYFKNGEIADLIQDKDGVYIVVEK